MGRPQQRNFDYEASFIIRGLSELHLKLTPAPGAVSTKSAAGTQQDQPDRPGHFQFWPAPREQTAAATHYSTADSKIGALLADPKAKAVVDKYFPGVSSDKRIAIGEGHDFARGAKVRPGHVHHRGARCGRRGACAACRWKAKQYEQGPRRGSHRRSLRNRARHCPYVLEQRSPGGDAGRASAGAGAGERRVAQNRREAAGPCG